jgi:hypothetical protein
MFEGIPDPSRSLDTSRRWMLVGVLGLLVSLAILMSLGTPKHVPWVVANGKLQIHTRFAWSEDYPVCDLEIGQARILDLTREPDWLPGKKVFGVGGFGYKAGNFYLRNGKEVELALAKETIAVLVPRRNDVPVMIGVTDPNALLSALRAACPSAAKL